MRLREFNEEVLFAEDRIVKVGRGEIDLLRKRAKGNKRNRMRLCTHQDTEDKVHEMFIAIQQGTYIRPHKHLNKSESFHIIEGSVDVVVFDDMGNITEVTRVAEHGSGWPFYHRISDPYYHTLLIRSEFLLFHEVTSGPFRQRDAEYAPWAPEESDVASATQFMRGLAQSVEAAQRIAMHHPDGKA